MDTVFSEDDIIHSDAVQSVADRALCQLFLNECHQKMGFSLEISRNKIEFKKEKPQKK